MSKPTLSSLPPSWGGPFVWMTRDDGTLYLSSVKGFKDGGKWVISQLKHLSPGEKTQLTDLLSKGAL